MPVTCIVLGCPVAKLPQTEYERLMFDVLHERSQERVRAEIAATARLAATFERSQVKPNA